MHKTLEEAELYMKTLLSSWTISSYDRVLIAPSFPLLLPMVEWTRGSCIEIGAQNIHHLEEGAFTGEVSGSLVKSLGGTFVLLGHSERRHLFHEGDSWIGQKVKRALDCSLQPILCFGETLEERESGRMEAVCKKQLLEGMQWISQEDLPKMLFAYEPVWAIGTGKHATPQMAGRAHALCRREIAAKWGDKAALQAPILYGGSVNQDNIHALMQEEEINGVLVGGASLNPDHFLKLIQYK